MGISKSMFFSMVETFYPRHLEDRFRAAWSESPFVSVVGPRAGGKTTLIHRMTLPDVRYVTLLDTAARESAIADPAGFIDLLGRPVIIDEVQHATGVIPEARLALPDDAPPGQYVLTGSSDVFSQAEIKESLAGRVEHITLWPLSQSEILRIKTHFIDTLFAGGRPKNLDTAPTREEIVQMLVSGGFPAALQRDSERGRRNFYRDYVRTLLERDLKTIADIRKPDDVRRLLNLLAVTLPGEVNALTLGRKIGIDDHTVASYLAHLKELFLVHELTAWKSGGVDTQEIKSSKFLFSDTGILSLLRRATAKGLMEEWEGYKLGILENFVGMELVKQIPWSETEPTVHHWRRGGDEVEFVLEADGQVCAIEVKASRSAYAENFDNLKSLRDRVGERWLRGIVLYTGSEILSFGDGLEAWPLQALWSD